MKQISIIFFVACLLTIGLSGCKNESHKLTLQDIEQGLKKTGVNFKIMPITKSVAYNQVKPAALLQSEDGQSMMIYVYKSQSEMKIGLEEFQKQEFNTIDYGFHDTAVPEKNALFIYHVISTKTSNALDHL